jgi:hypothetical protein
MRALALQVDDAATTLVFAPPVSGAGGETCSELLWPESDSPTVLWITYTRSPSACVDAYRNHGGSASALSVITVGDTPAADDPLLSDVVTDTVATPSDLTGLGIKLSQFLAEHDDVALCFDSLTALLQHVDVETVYEFLHAVTGQLYAADARAHFHLDPTAHDRETVDALASLFDAVVTASDGGRDVRMRKLLQ